MKSARSLNCSNAWLLGFHFTHHLDSFGSKMSQDGCNNLTLAHQQIRWPPPSHVTFPSSEENIARTRKERVQKGLEDDEEEALDQLRMLEEEMHDMCSATPAEKKAHQNRCCNCAAMSFKFQTIITVCIGMPFGSIWNVIVLYCN